MNRYKEIILERPEALRFIKKRLGYGHYLSNYILKTIDLESSYVTTAIPENGNIENIYNFEYGGIIPEPPESEWRKVTAENCSKSIMVPVHTMMSHVIDTVQLYLKQSGRLCIIEDDVARSSDPFLKKIKTNFVTFQDNVYHYLREGKYTNTEIQRNLKSAGSFLHVGVLTSIPVDNESVFSGHIITENFLTELAKRVEKMFFLAYDMESYVLWHRK